MPMYYCSAHIGVWLCSAHSTFVQHVADNLQAHPNFKLHKYSDQGHFNTVAECPDLLKVVLERVGVSSS